MQLLKYIVFSALFFTLILCDCTTQTCHTSNECSGSSCTRCTTDNTGTLGQCVIGWASGHGCTKNSDCDATTDTVCTNGTCTSAPLATTQGASCQNNFQCNSQTYSRCVGSVCSPAGSCAATCLVDTDCSQLYSCKWCITDAKGNKACKVQLNSPCQTDSQCAAGTCNLYNSGPNKICSIQYST